MLKLVRRWEDGGICQVWGNKCPIRAALQLKWVWTVYHCFMIFILSLAVHWHLSFSPLPLWMVSESCWQKLSRGHCHFQKLKLRTCWGKCRSSSATHYKEVSRNTRSQHSNEEKWNITGSRFRHNTHLYHSKSLLATSGNGSKFCLDRRTETFAHSCQTRMSNGLVRNSGKNIEHLPSTHEREH